jgi:quercetin dioxygenase-like cupin family protein
MTRTATFVLAACAAVSLSAVTAAAQSPAQGQRGGGPAAPPSDPAAISQVSAANYREMEVDPGVFYATVMDRPEVRIGHVRVAPNGSRRSHTHDDVIWHVMVPLNGTVRLTIGTDAPIDASAGKVYFLKPHVPHAFTNASGAEVQIIEFFVKPQPGAAAGALGNTDDVKALALAMAAAAGASR